MAQETQTGRRITTQEASIKTAAVEIKALTVSGDSKKCGPCGEMKPLSDFPTNRSRHKGVASYCRNCTATYLAQWNRDNPNGGYRQKQRQLEVASRSSKTCRLCKADKILSDFYKMHTSPDGHGYECKSCSLERDRDYKKAYPERRSAVVRASKLRRLFRLSPEQYDDLVALQDGRCAICSRPSGDQVLGVDHDHKTGRVRGLLCGLCNVQLAAVERPGFVVAAAGYLLRTGSMEQAAALSALDQLFIAV